MPSRGTAPATNGRRPSSTGISGQQPPRGVAVEQPEQLALGQLLDQPVGRRVGVEVTGADSVDGVAECG